MGIASGEAFGQPRVGDEAARLGGFEIVDAPDIRAGRERINAAHRLAGRAKKIVAAAARVQSQSERGALDVAKADARLEGLAEQFAALPQTVLLGLPIDEARALFAVQMRLELQRLRERDDEEAIILLLAA